MPKIHRMSENHYAFHCPGCECGHEVRVIGPHPVWSWNGSEESPTFAPSILIRSGHFVPDRPHASCWCTYNAEHPSDPAPFKCSVCHSFVKDGQIQFLTDCTHKLAGQTVDLPEWD